MDYPFNNAFNGCTVLVTGHTGFKGSWLSLWLQELGARVIGYSLPPPTTPSNFEVAHVGENMEHVIGDIRDFARLQEVLLKHQPDVVFHLAAQPIVLHSFEFPKETFDVNVGGTVNVLEAIRHCPSVKAAVMVTSDKCYLNQEWLWGYRESDTLGGHDPYSASKGMAEQAISAYQHSFFSKANSPAVASVRAGNVIGGGDFADQRIVPDCMKALMANTPIHVRNPYSVRPWLNVLDPLSGYLWLAVKLLNEGSEYAEAWNFGPLEQEAITVQTLVEKALSLWGRGDWIQTEKGSPSKREMNLLRLNWDKAANKLGWKPTYNWIDALQQTVDWFKSYEIHIKGIEDVDMRAVCLQHIHDYHLHAAHQQVSWANVNHMSST